MNRQDWEETEEERRAHKLAAQRQNVRRQGARIKRLMRYPFMRCQH